MSEIFTNFTGIIITFNPKTYEEVQCFLVSSMPFRPDFALTVTLDPGALFAVKKLSYKNLRIYRALLARSTLGTFPYTNYLK